MFGLFKKAGELQTELDYKQAMLTELEARAADSVVRIKHVRGEVVICHAGQEYKGDNLFDCIEGMVNHS